MSVAHPRTPLETVIDALAARGRKPRGNDRGWTALCPAHEDSTPSMSVGLGQDDRVLIHCHAGCATSDILTALGLTVADLFTGPRTNGTRRVEDARYRYVDELGNHIFDVVRTWTEDGKRFHQEPTNDRRGAGAMDGVRRIPYRLPQLLEAVQAGHTVYVTEGEKDVHAIERAGHVATTNPGGAGKWRTDYNQYFTGAHVVVVADRDKAGRDHAHQVAEALEPLAADVRIVEPTQGKDVYDHLAAGLTVDQLVDPNTIDDDGLPFIDWAEFWNREHLGEEWLIPDVFALGRGHALYAAHKQGKSLFVLCRCAELAATRPDVDVIYLDYEMSDADLRERLDDMGYGPESDLSRLHYWLLPNLPPLDTGEGAAAVLAIIDQVQRPSCHVLVIIDTTGRAVEGKENDNDTIRAFYQWTGIALKRRGHTWARIDHAGKDPTRGQRGGSAKGDDVDVVWKLQATDSGVTLHREVTRMSWVEEKITYTIKTDPLRYERSEYAWPAGTKELTRQLDELGVPLDLGRTKVRPIIKQAGIPASNDVLSAAIKWRRGQPQILADRPEDRSKTITGDRLEDSPQDIPLTSTDSLEDRSGQVPAASGDSCPPLLGDSVPADPDTPTPCLHCGAPPHDTTTHRYIPDEEF